MICDREKVERSEMAAGEEYFELIRRFTSGEISAEEFMHLTTEKRKYLFGLIDDVLAGRISFVQFSRSYYPVYLEMVPGFLTEQEEGFFSIVQDKLDWTVEQLNSDAVKFGLMNRAGFLEWLEGKTEALRCGSWF